MIASSLGGVTAVLVALGLLTVVVVAVATGIDRVTGPGVVDPSGAFLRGLALGVVGTTAAAVFGVAVLEADLREALADPLLCAAAALPFPVVAGLQWPGPVRRATTLVTLLGMVALLAAWYPGARQSWQDDRVVTEVGTLARPWVTEVDGFGGQSPQHTGSDLIWTTLLPVDGAAAPGLRLFRDALTSIEGDPCATGVAPRAFADQSLLSCRQVAPDRWSFTTEQWHVLVGREEDAWVGVAAAPDVSRGLLEAALAGARPMTEDEYGAWLDEVLP